MNEFSNDDSLGSKSRTMIAGYLRQIGDDEAAQRFSGKGGGGQGLTAKFLGSDQYSHTGILLGYIDPQQVNSDEVNIENALTLSNMPELKDTRIKITLDKLFIQSFPGTGTHEILCEFAGKNQISSDPEEMRFALTTQARDGASAALSGAPIFLGVSVGKNGVAFEGRLVNVKSNADELLIATLGSDTFQSGLNLLTCAQPALKPFVGLAGSVVKAVAARSQNCQVFAFKLGLDFGGGATSARLRHGSYVIIQADSESWDWNAVHWNPNTQTITDRKTGKSISFNYLVLGVSAFEG